MGWRSSRMTMWNPIFQDSPNPPAFFGKHCFAGAVCISARKTSKTNTRTCKRRVWQWKLSGFKCQVPELQHTSIPAPQISPNKPGKPVQEPTTSSLAPDNTQLPGEWMRVLRPSDGNPHSECFLVLCSVINSVKEPQTKGETQKLGSQEAI